jgi:hypothetical protein
MSVAIEMFHLNRFFLYLGANRDVEAWRPLLCAFVEQANCVDRRFL